VGYQHAADCVEMVEWCKHVLCNGYHGCTLGSIAYVNLSVNGGKWHERGGRHWGIALGYSKHVAARARG
jgi:hypothetical protein